MLSQKYGLKFSYIKSGIFVGFLTLLTKTKWTNASVIISSFLVIICIIENEVFVISLTKDLMLNSSSKYADFLYWILQDLTIMKASKSSLIFLLLNPRLFIASVLALSKKFK